MMNHNHHALVLAAFMLQLSAAVLGLSSYEPKVLPKPPIQQVASATLDDIINGVPKLLVTKGQLSPATHPEFIQHSQFQKLLHDGLNQVYISQGAYRQLFNELNQKQTIKGDDSKLSTYPQTENRTPLLNIVYPNFEPNLDAFKNEDGSLQNYLYDVKLIDGTVNKSPLFTTDSSKSLTPNGSDGKSKVKHEGDVQQHPDNKIVPWVQDTYIERALYREPEDLQYHHETRVAVPHSIFIDPGAISADHESVSYVQDHHGTRSSQQSQTNHDPDHHYTSPSEKDNTGHTISNSGFPVSAVQDHLEKNPLVQQNVNLIGDYHGTFDHENTQINGLIQPEHQKMVLSNTYHPHDTESFIHYLPCTEEFYLTYDYDFSGTVWQGIKGQVGIANHEAVFTGHGSLIIPFFACNDLLPRYSMRFTIRPEHSQHNMALLGNSLDPNTSSFQVTVSGYNLKLAVRPRSDWETSQSMANRCFWPWESPSVLKVGHGITNREKIVVLSVPLEPGHNTVTIVQEDGHIFLSANDHVAYGQGNLPALTREPLYVGAGADPVSGTVLPLYKGTFDSFVFEKCPTRLRVNAVAH